MAAATDLLNELGVPPRIARASREWLEQLADPTVHEPTQDPTPLP
jgi:hypothetical protein